MFNNITRDSFNVDLLIPAIQTAATFAAAQVLGKLGQYVVRNQTAVLVSAVASTVAAVASNFFNKAYLYYAALPVGIGTGLVAHTFFYPGTSFRQVLDIKGIIIIAAVLASVKLISDNLAFFRKQEQKAEGALLDAEEGALEVAERVIDSGKKKVVGQRVELEREIVQDDSKEDPTPKSPEKARTPKKVSPEKADEKGAAV